MKKTIKKRKGFSLVEVLFALMVLSVGISAISVLMTSNIKNSIDAKNQIIAANLAQEGVELVRNLKDNGEPNLAATTANDYAGLSIDKTMSKLETNTVASKQLFLNGNFYTHSSSGKSTGFYRSISLKVSGVLGTPSSRIIEVTSYVSWNETGSFSPCISANKCASVVAVLPDME
jgi:type IV pilus modification protein PilV